MKEPSADRLLGIGGVGLGLCGWQGPHVWPDMPTYLSYPMLAIGVGMTLWAVVHALIWHSAIGKRLKASTSVMPQAEFLRLADVVKRITSSANISGGWDGLAIISSGGTLADAATVVQRAAEKTACNVLREKALQGQIAVFGGINYGSTPPAQYDAMVREKIPVEYWKTHSIGFDGDPGQRGCAADLSGRPKPRDYYGIWFNKMEIDRQWPAR